MPTACGSCRRCRPACATSPAPAIRWSPPRCSPGSAAPRCRRRSPAGSPPPRPPSPASMPSRPLWRRGLPIALATGGSGATTVAATMIAAAAAGIAVFVTGGIGGVHRGGESSLDISADLEELARTPVAVVCAGAKAILDLPRTLEYLETRGVPVIGFQTSVFPAFYTRGSGLTVDHRAGSADEVARIMVAQWRLGKRGAIEGT